MSEQTMNSRQPANGQFDEIKQQLAQIMEMLNQYLSTKSERKRQSTTPEVTNEQILKEVKGLRHDIEQLTEKKPGESTEVTEEDLKRVKKAYRAVRDGRQFVRVHKVRDYLDWPREKFDQALDTLRRKFDIQLHGGDPSKLTEEEIRNSYRDEAGRLYIAMSVPE